MRRSPAACGASAVVLAVLCSGCGELGLSLDISAKSDVPALDSVRVEVVQGPVLVEQTFMLGTTTLPQSLAIVSKGMTRGTVEVTVQGLVAGRVEAVAHTTGTLEPATRGARVSAVLERLCLAGMACGCGPRECSTSAPRSCGLIDDGCGGKRSCAACSGTERCESGLCRAAVCKAKTCTELGANCGLAVDGCGATIDCGTCGAGLNCGGGSGPNVCGTGNCTRRTSCDAGAECGATSDNCGGVLSCGTCPMAGACGLDLRCCSRDTSCDPLQCGPQSDGCGGTHSCPNNCANGRTCGPAPGGGTFTRCNCSPPLIDCNGACVNPLTDAQHCGGCGRTCPGAQSCSSGMCPCVDAGSNADGHCCPPGWFLSARLASTSDMRCFKGPFDAGTESEGLAQCRRETDAGFARAVSALGDAIGESAAAAVPSNACGSHLRGLNDQVIDAENGMLTLQSVCFSFCQSSSCACTTCNCSGVPARGCAQKYYCVMDPLGPKVSGPCSDRGDCPPGMTCSSGLCVDAGTPFCVLDSDCGPVARPRCRDRGAKSSTGLCE